jgi:hypothetical protein
MIRLSLVAALLLLNTTVFAQHHPVKKALTTPAPHDKFASVQFRNGDVVVRRLSIPAGDSAPVSGSIHDYLLVSYGQNSLSVSGYQTNFDVKLADGEIQVLQGGWPHTIKNDSQQTSEIVIVEVARNISPRNAICGLGPKSCSQARFGKSAQGEYQQGLLFETDSTAVYRAQLGPGVPMHQHSDNRKHLIIAVTPLEGHVDTQTFSLKPGEIFWQPGSFEEIGNDGSATATMLILELK